MTIYIHHFLYDHFIINKFLVNHINNIYMNDIDFHILISYESYSFYFYMNS